MNVLHIGSGRKSGWEAEKLFAYVGLSAPADDVMVTHLDADERLAPDLVCELGAQPIPLPDDSVDLIIAWHVLEHVGKQGETAEWFHAWEELYRVLKPDGWLYGESPYYDSLWAWQDPTHTRVIGEGSFTFFRQDSYRNDTMISPYRIRCDFVPMSFDSHPPLCVHRNPAQPAICNFRFSLQAIKPLKPWWEDAREAESAGD